MSSPVSLSPSEPSNVPPSVELPDRNERTREALLRLGRRVRALREKAGMTQEALATRSGISVSFASLLERGERSPSYETLVALAEALEQPLEMLFRDEGASSLLEASSPGTVVMEDSPLAPLLAFGRAARLSSLQVERLLRVAQAMFEGNGTESPVSKRPPCAASDCERPVLARGLCATHYHRARRAERF